MGKTVVAYYDDDNVNKWAVSISNGWIGSPNSIWGTDPPRTPIVPLPSGVRMRYFTLKDANGRHRNVPIQYRPTWESTPIGTVLHLPTNDGTRKDWTVIGKGAQSNQPRKYTRHRRRI